MNGGGLLEVLHVRKRSPLTDVQMQIVRLASDGLGSKTIAARMGMSMSAVGHQRDDILGRLRAASMCQVVAICVRRGWI